MLSVCWCGGEGAGRVVTGSFSSNSSVVLSLPALPVDSVELKPVATCVAMVEGVGVVAAVEPSKVV